VAQDVLTHFAARYNAEAARPRLHLVSRGEEAA
jgi:hypothetical protein